MMTDSTPPNPYIPPDPSARVSPIRPVRPEPTPDRSAPSQPSEQTAPQSEPDIDPSTDPQIALQVLRRKMEAISDEFSAGKLNRAQFNAMYKRYSEQRTIIERLVARNPDSDAWKQVIAQRGQTGFLRSQFAAAPLMYALFLHGNLKPLIRSGAPVLPDDLAARLLMRVWNMPNRPNQGLGRRQLANDEWLIMATGEYASTLVVFSQEPAISQVQLVRDQHADFERANLTLLSRGSTAPERMVFPQRSLLETKL